MSFDFPATPIVEVTDIDGNMMDAELSRAWSGWLSLANHYLQGLTESGTTANRPTKGLWVGRMYFDTSLGAQGKPIWRDKDNANWVDATGAIV